MMRVRKFGSKYRLVDEATGKIAVTKNGRFVDGGGHKDQAKAERQIGYINKALADKER